MAEISHHSKVRLENFTAFADATFEFCPGINAIIGENGTGKTHLMKALYAGQRPRSREVPDTESALKQLFQVEDFQSLIRISTERSVALKVDGMFGSVDWGYRIDRRTNGDEHGGVYSSSLGLMTRPVSPSRPVFIPATDMLGHSKGFKEAYNTVFLDFDLTCYDLLGLLSLRGRAEVAGALGEARSSARAAYGAGTGTGRDLQSILQGEVVEDETSGRFYLLTATGRMEMPLVAEGLRKVATLIRLKQNQWLLPGATLFWDEPEVNINPVLMRPIVAELLSLARHGVQVFLTTHSYVILKELDLQAGETDPLRYFSLSHSSKGSLVTASESLSDLEPNSILGHYGNLYDRDLDRTLGGVRTRGSV